MHLRTLSIACVVAVMATLPGCRGGGAKVESEISTTTKGQQLLDLKKALDAGAMNEKEYEEQRKKILKD